MFVTATPGCLDKGRAGVFKNLKDLLANMGDNFTEDEIKQTWKEAPLEKGKFDYNTFVGILKGKEEEAPN